MIVDGCGMIAGRLATKIAKLIITGESVTVVNAESIVMTGNKVNIMENFKQRVDARVLSNPLYGPKYSRIPSKIFRRSVKGMLPDKNRTTERIIKRLTVYNSVPKELATQKMEVFEEFRDSERHKSMTLKEIAELLGGKW